MEGDGDARPAQQLGDRVLAAAVAEFLPSYARRTTSEGSRGLRGRGSGRLSDALLHPGPAVRFAGLHHPCPKKDQGGPGEPHDQEQGAGPEAGGRGRQAQEEVYAQHGQGGLLVGPSGLDRQLVGMGPVGFGPPLPAPDPPQEGGRGVHHKDP